ncbi:MAG: hypothetical protein MJZ75_04975 [Paludibacteraceae bacterium]|nr:hypothetical protein [Paludibacteraceae bacterium]
MRKLFLALMAVAAVALTGCKEKNEPANTEPKKDGFTIEKLRAVGREIPNPKITFDECIPEGSEATLKSIRYVKGKPIYYMDYTAKVDWESLLTQPWGEHFDVFCMANVTAKVSKALFSTPVPQGELPDLAASCSGFICTNTKGEMLNCRNFDGDYGEMVVVFNHNVKPGEHKSVMMTDLNGAQKFSGILDKYAGDTVLLRKDIELNVLLRQPLSTVDGMNDAGLVLTCYQLPDFQAQDSTVIDPYPSPTPRPYGTDQRIPGKKQANFIALANLTLAKCTTVEEVVDLFKSYNYVALDRSANLHWCFSDANGKWLTLEYWRDESKDVQIVGNPKGQADILYVYDENARSQSAFLGNHNIAYEYKSMENYYYHPTPSSTFYTDYWQRAFGGVFRAHNMMSHYSLVMDEEEALRVLQYGNYGIEVPGQVTNWSCVYNSTQRTILFNVRDQADRAFTIDLKTDL